MGRLKNRLTVFIAVVLTLAAALAAVAPYSWPI